MSGEFTIGSSAAAEARIQGIIGGPARFAALLAFTSLGCADALASGPATTQALAAGCDGEPDSLGRVLRCCASLGIITPDGGGRWVLTPAGRTLTSGGSMRAAVMARNREPAWRALLHLDDAVRSGLPVLRGHAGGSDASPDQTGQFQQYMTSRSAPAAQAAAGLDYGDVREIADIGGGYGTIITAVLAAHPHLRGVLLDRPDVLPGAREYLARHGLGDGRCLLVPGDYLRPAAIPVAGVYILGSILHNHDDTEARQILDGLRAANPGARVLLAEIILPEDPREPDAGADMDMRRLAAGGKERTRSEWDALLGSAGLAIAATVPTASPVEIIDTRPRTREGHPA